MAEHGSNMFGGQSSFGLFVCLLVCLFVFSVLFLGGDDSNLHLAQVNDFAAQRGVPSPVYKKYPTMEATPTR